MSQGENADSRSKSIEQKIIKVSNFDIKTPIDVK